MRHENAAKLSKAVYVNCGCILHCLCFSLACEMPGEGKVLLSLNFPTLVGVLPINALATYFTQAL